MTPTVDKLYKRFYPPHIYRDEDAQFDASIRRAIRAGDVVLDAGAGAGELFANDYRSLCSEVIGVDLDERIVTNPRLSRGLIGSLEQLPLPTGSVDLVYCRYVFEHLADPLRVIAEFARVLRSGGRAIVMTPSRWHYVTVASAATPLWFHRLYNRWRGRAESDTFPTHYRANTKGTLTSLFTAEGFSPLSVAEIETAPNYLTLLAPAFLVGVAYERLVNRLESLSRFRVLLLGEFVKTAD